MTRAWAFAVIEMGCKAPDFWSLTPAEYGLLVEQWKSKMVREGYTFKMADTPEIRRDSQAAMLHALKALAPKT